MTARRIRYSNELLCSENCFACVTEIALRLCLAWTKWILLFSCYACSNVYILYLFTLFLCTIVRLSYEINKSVVFFINIAICSFTFTYNGVLYDRCITTLPEIQPCACVGDNRTFTVCDTCSTGRLHAFMGRLD